MKGYNGFPNWTQWNVSLWINNDEGLYRLAQSAKREHTTKNAAARAMLEYLPEKTPDGARYTFTSVRRALAD